MHPAMPTDIQERCDTIEACYEFTLSYAAQGLLSDEGSPSGKQLRDHLARAVAALRGIDQSCAAAVKQEQLSSRRQIRGVYSRPGARCAKLARRH